MEVPTGSKLGRKICFSEEQMRENEQAARDLYNAYEQLYRQRCIVGCRR
jgi:hypothetical protein